MPDQNKTVFVIDDEREICESLKLLFESAGINVRIWLTPVDFLVDYKADQQGCLLVDVKMPTMDGFEFLEVLKTLQCNMPVIMFTGYGDIQMAVKAMKAGAADFLTKPLSDEILLEKIRYYLDADVKNASFVSSFFPPQTKLLTKREQQVMDLILSGKFNKEIADELNISNSTVEAHRARIMKKFEVKNVVQLIRKYYQIDNKPEISLTNGQ